MSLCHTISCRAGFDKQVCSETHDSFYIVLVGPEDQVLLPVIMLTRSPINISPKSALFIWIGMVAMRQQSYQKAGEHGQI